MMRAKRNFALRDSENKFPSTPRSPRMTWQRLSHSDPEHLSDLELIEQILHSAIPDQNVRKIAFTLLAQFGSYAQAIRAPKAELETVEGLGEDGVYALRLMHVTMIRALRAEIIKRPVFSSWEPLIKYLSALLAHDKKEKFHCLFLDPRNRLIADETIAEGSVNYLHIYPREIIHKTLALHATAIILVHNHPTGNPSPSKDDITMTSRIKNAAQPLGIALHDHIIIGKSGWYSFAQKRWHKARSREFKVEEEISWDN